ncbi:hypothetical protein QFC20_001745 [Naganishia adeliensis]|uniref:Uncharacterized protein n=1 Tax=Naganishia adeliensis TaxID=92952 RepID=A0ACC2WQ16_9TREE|nr:hypothetical protein QFC20_001745 [Naganishia adeliensis]
MSSFRVPTTMKALVQHESEPRGVIRDVPVPKLGKNEILIKVAYVAQNSIDWKMAAGMSPPNAIHGFDFAGVVVALGEDLADSERKVGDPVAGMVHGGGYPDKGAFAEYLRAESDLVWSVPKSVSMREAVGVTATFATAALGFFNKLDLVYPLDTTDEAAKGDRKSTWILIYGGSSSVGLFAIQLAKFAGYSVITTCSPRNFDLVKEHGADVVVDYHDSDAAVEKIREPTSGTLTSALDCISEADSAVICVKSLAQGGKGTVVQVGPPSDAAAQLASEKNVDMERVMAFTLFGHPVPLGPNFTVPASPEDRAFYVKLNKDLPVFFEKLV